MKDNLCLVDSVNRNSYGHDIPIFISNNGCKIFSIYKPGIQDFYLIFLERFMIRVFPQFQNLESQLVGLNLIISQLLKIVALGLPPIITPEELQNTFDSVLIFINTVFNNIREQFILELQEEFNLTRDQALELGQEYLTDLTFNQTILTNFLTTIYQIVLSVYIQLINQEISVTPEQIDQFITSVNTVINNIFSNLEPGLEPNPLVLAELFLNVNCKLVSQLKIQILSSNNDGFTTINGGYASPCFDRFVILDSNATSVRVRIFDINGRLINSVIFDDYFSESNSFKGGEISQSGCLIQISYMINARTTTIKIFDFNLNVLFSFNTKGLIIGSGKFISLEKCCKTFLVFQMTDYENTLSNDTVAVNYNSSRFSLVIYELNCQDNILTEVASERLPQLAVNYDIINLCDKVYILLGTITPNYIINLDNKKDYCKGLRLYSFNGCKLKLKSSSKTQFSIYPLFLCKNICSETQKILIANVKYIEQEILYQNSLSLIHINNFNLKCVEYKSLSVTIPQLPIIKASANCCWVIVSGKSNDNINNIQLYKLCC